jgi:hypothetical protein
MMADGEVVGASFETGEWGFCGTNWQLLLLQTVEKTVVNA